MKLGDIFEARVMDIAQDGRGVVKTEAGQVMFAPGVWLDELARFKVVELKSKFGRAELVELIEPSPERIEPICKHQGFDQASCGGCPWQIVSYPAQLKQKQARVEAAFAKLDKKIEVKPIWASSEFGYRNRAQFKSDGESIGYLAAGSRSLVPIQTCPILSEHNQSVLDRLNASLPRKEWRPKGRQGRNQRWTTIDIDETVNAETASVNQRLPFQQANDTQNNNMREWLERSMAGIDRKAKILELFCGSGNFTEVLSRSGFEDIIAVEASLDAIESLKQKKLSGVKPVEANLFDDKVFEKLHFQYPGAEVLVLDPPREGLKVTQGLFPKKNKFHSIFYISCDLATLLRDLEFFQTKGFKLQEIQPLDQFPHTPHIELLVHMAK